MNLYNKKKYLGYVHNVEQLGEYLFPYDKSDILLQMSKVNLMRMQVLDALRNIKSISELNSYMDMYMFPLIEFEKFELISSVVGSDSIKERVFISINDYNNPVCSNCTNSFYVKDALDFMFDTYMLEFGKRIEERSNLRILLSQLDGDIHTINAFLFSNDFVEYYVQ